MSPAHHTAECRLSPCPEKAALGGNEHFLVHTRDVWQMLYATRPTETEAREIIQNLSAFFNLLAEWDLTPDHAQHGPIEDAVHPDGAEA